MVADRIEQARSQGGTRESVTIEWRGQPCHIDVVPMPIADLYYNPETHRIRAQRDHDLAKDKGLTSDPWSDESQEYLHYLLTADPADPSRRDVNFDNLMDDLRLYEQKDPGIITPSGILVNGNTRHAALRELGRENIRVGVLPGDWTWPDIRAVELELQLRKEHRRDYSYINQLIAIEDEAARGLPEAEICKKFRIQSKTFRQARWILQFVRDAIERSKVELPDGSIAGMRLVDFEDHQEKLKELQRKYVELEPRDHEGAERMKENRLIAIVLGKAKTDIRWIEPNFREKHLEGKLPAQLKFDGEGGGDRVSIPGLSPRATVTGESKSVKAAKATTDAVLKAKATSSAGKAPAATLQEANDLINSMDAALEKGIRAAGRDGSLRKRKAAAPEKLSDANDLLKSVVDDIVEARSKGLLDIDALDEGFLVIRRTLAAIVAQVSRGVSEPGDGLLWLQRATREGE
ncbi:transcriptional regulator [Actinoplanes sp. NBRC 103695]|uniref:transcriptional regulator n=1 Tax=Actinoplanes sp. NBRC 103695 TaxID=3032202 RepID=UPI0025533301|nr:transcriptional regulator [Actinoplanes sp. NBRC 103695]